MRVFKKVLCALVAIVLVERIFAFALEPITYYHFLRLDEKEMEAKGFNPELVFFGDSRCVRTFIPNVFEKKIEEIDDCVNAGVNQQHIVSTYYYMKDYFERYDVKCAVVNLNYDYLLNLVEEPVVVKGLTVDRIQSPKIMLEYIKDHMTVNDYPDLLSSYRYRHRINDFWKDLSTKLQAEYWMGIDVSDDVCYVDKGYATWDLAYEQGNIGTPVNCNAWSEETINSENLVYLEKIAELCKQHEVELVFMESPISVSRMYAIDGYSDFHKQISELCQTLDVPFWNLNMLMENNVSLDDTLFSDTEHLNNIGAEKTSEIVGCLLEQHLYEKKDVSEYFYDSFGEFDLVNARIGSCDLEVWEWPLESGEIPMEKVIEAGIDINYYMEKYASYDSKDTAFYVMRATSFASESIDVNYQFSYVEYDDNIRNKKAQENISKQWINDLQYEILRPYGKEQYILVERSELPAEVAFRLDVCPVAGEDVHHCYRTTLD